MMLEPGSTGRFRFFDAIRLSGVLAVVALHAAVAYSTLAPWWYVAETTRSDGINVLLSATDGFPMPLLFAVAGYFALPSLARRGPAGFLAAKLRRLGLPLAALTLFYTPIITYVDYLDKGGDLGYFKFWLSLLPSLLDWSFQYFGAPDGAAKAQTMLLSYHLWFLAVLLVFCGLLAAFRNVSGLAARAGQGAGYGRFVLVVLGTALVEGLAQMMFSDMAWARFGPFFVFQPARLPIYAGFFLMGLFAWKRGWFVRYPAPGRAWAWGVAVVLAFGAMGGGGMAVMAPGPKSSLLLFAYGLARTGFGLAATGLLVVVGQRCWNNPGRTARSLTDASYDIYLYHFPPVVVLQYLLVGAALPVSAKFSIAFLTPCLLCWAASNLAGRCGRFWLPAGVAAAFGACLLVWG